MRAVIARVLRRTLLRGVVREQDLHESVEKLRSDLESQLSAVEYRTRAAAREHTEASSQAVFEAVLAAAREHAEAASRHAESAAVDAAREHTEASSQAVFEAVLAAAREHAEAASRHAESAAVDAAREHAQAAVEVAISLLETRRASSNQELIEHVDQALDGFSRALSELRRAMRHLESSQRSVSRTDVVAADTTPSTKSTASYVSPALYAEIEDRFRGSEDEIAERQNAYLNDVTVVLRENSARAIDIGSGRGEWIATLQRACPGVEVTGIDTNEVFVEECRTEGLTVVHADALEHLRTMDDEQVDLVTMFHVAEHLALETLDELCAEIARVTKPGGLFICETPNCSSLSVGASTFWIDPTHPRPLHPEVLRFVAQRAGFPQVELRLLHPVTPEPLASIDRDRHPELAVIIDTVWGHGDVAVMARR